MDNKSNIVITADSTCDLPQDLIEKNGITVIPLTVLVGESVYRDGVDIRPNDIYDYVAKTGELPKTSAVTPETYYNVFKNLTDEGKKVVHIGFSSGLSSSYQNACVAAGEVENVYCVDSKNLCTAMDFLCLRRAILETRVWTQSVLPTRLISSCPR